MFSSGALGWIKQTTVFKNRVAVGHARYVIGDDTCAAAWALGGFDAACSLAVFFGHQAHVGHECAEQGLEHALRLARHAQHAMMAIDALAQELL
jgi:hypothetical protein